MFNWFELMTLKTGIFRQVGIVLATPFTKETCFSYYGAAVVTHNYTKF